MTTPDITLALPPRPTSAPQATDALTAWLAPADAPATLAELQIRDNETLVIPFTTTLVPVGMHFPGVSTFRGYARCPGDGCGLCKVGKKVERRDLLPVYDPVAGRVAVLAVSPNLRPGALAPLLMAHLATVKSSGTPLLGLKKTGPYTFAVTPYPALAGTDFGIEAIIAFQQAFEDGTIRLEDIFPVLDAAAVAAIPEFASHAKLVGVTL